MKKSSSAQSKGKARSGGGLTSNKRREVGYRGGNRRMDVINVEAVDALGQRTAYKKPDLVNRTPKDFVPLGNDLAAKVECGPGGSRTIYKSGFQALTGKVSPGEGGITGTADRGNRAILGAKGSKV